MHLKRTGPAEFPDAVTARGSKHLVELSEMVRQGNRAAMFYLVQRMDCDSFTIAADIDPRYAKNLEQALAEGVKILCYSCTITVDKITLDHPLPIIL